ncbi:MAG: thiamine phosphate synthase [bacterium]
MKSKIDKGIYLITQNGQDFTQPSQQALLEHILTEGISCLQYRNKLPANHRQQISIIRDILSESSTPLIINDNPELCLLTHSSGVHLGKDDSNIDDTRKRLGPKAIIGASSYNDLSRAAKLATKEIDYIAFGAMYPSLTKKQAVSCPVSTLIDFNHAFPSLPAIAIGGIKVENSRPIIKAGAHCVALISSVWNASDPVAIIKDFNQLFQDYA